jgi:hypothetical protein
MSLNALKVAPGSIERVPALARVSGWALAAVSAAGLGLACVGCTPTAKPAAAPSVTVSRPATTTTAGPSATAARSPKPTNLAAGAAVRQELLAAFTAFRANASNTPGFAAIAPSAISGITPGTLYYAFDSATGTYWAVATFSATKAASQTSAYVGFQDGGNEAVFMRPSGEQWLVKSVGTCLRGLPVAVAAALTLTASPSPMCPSGVPAA